MKTKVEIYMTLYSFNGDPKINVSHSVMNKEGMTNRIYSGHAKHKIEFTMDTVANLSEHKNSILIEHYDKNYKTDTTENDDKGVMIEAILLNGMAFPHMVMEGDFWIEGSKPGEKIKTNWLGHNGIYELRYPGPVETWIINKLNIDLNS